MRNEYGRTLMMLIFALSRSVKAGCRTRKASELEAWLYFSIVLVLEFENRTH